MLQNKSNYDKVLQKNGSVRMHNLHYNSECVFQYGISELYC